MGSAGAEGARSSSGPKPILDFPPGGANTLLLLFAQGSSPEYITVELAAIANLLSCFKFRAGGGAGTKRMPRRALKARLPQALPYQGPSYLIGASSSVKHSIGTSLENHHRLCQLLLCSADSQLSRAHRAATLEKLGLRRKLVPSCVAR